MRELTVQQSGPRSLGFVVPRDLALQHKLAPKDEVFFTPLLEQGVYMRAYNPLFGAPGAPQEPAVGRRLRPVGRSKSPMATVPSEFHERLGLDAQMLLLAVEVRGGLYLYPWSEERRQSLEAYDEVLRDYRDVLHALGEG